MKNKAEAAKMLEMPWQTPEDIEKEKVAQQDHLIMTFFRDYVGPFLMKKPVKVSFKFNLPEKKSNKKLEIIDYFWMVIFSAKLC